MAIKKFKIEASEQAKQLAKKPVKASDGDWDTAVIRFMDTIPYLPKQGEVISKKYKGFPIVIVGLGDGKCLYNNNYLQQANAASDIRFIRDLIKRGDAPEKAVENLGFKTYTRGDVEGACGGKKKPVKSAADKKRWGLYSDFGQRILNETFDSKREAQKAFREYGYTKDSEAWIEEVDETEVGKFDKKPANNACGGKKTVKAGRDNLNYRPKKKSIKSSKRSRSVKAASADGYDFAFYRDGYRVLTKTENNRGKWLAQKDNEEPFEITYEQARGFEPIDPRNRALQMKLGKALKLPIRSSAVKAAKKDNMNKEAHKWYNISLTKDEYAKFRKFLKENGYKYESSEEGQNTYVKVYLTKADADKVNKFLESMDDVESACGGKKSKKTVKAETYKRTSDARPYKDRKYWYFTTHGIGPGTIPRDLKILDVQEGQNKKGTWGDFILLDGVLNYDELKKYDMIELPPENPNTYGIFLGDDAEPIQIFEYKEDALDALDRMRQEEDYGKDFRFGKVRKINSSVSSKKKTVKASAAAKRRAEKSVKASKYYEITDHYNDEVGRADTEDEARELAKKLVRENDVEYYDIFWVDTDPDSTDDTSYIDTVYADKPFSVEGYLETNFRGLSDSDTFYELRDALDYAQELLGKGLSVRMECENAGGRLEITPDEYDEFVQTSDGAIFEDMPEVAEWLHQVQVERMDSYQEPWLDNWQYNTDIGMSVKCSIDSEYNTEILAEVDDYIVNNYPLWVTTDWVIYNGPDDWSVAVFADDRMVLDDFIYFFNENNTYVSDRLKTAGILTDALSGNDFKFELYPYQGQWTAPQINVDGEVLEEYGDTGELYSEILTQRANFEAMYINALQDVNEHIGEFLKSYDSGSDVETSIDINAAIEKGNKTDYASNPIYELDKYVKDLAEGVAAAAGITLTYQISDEAITFIDGDGTAVFIQPISEITPEPDDLEDDIQQLVSAIQYEDMDNPEYWPTDTSEDDPDYATRAVQMSVDAGLEPVMGEGEDIGFGVDSYGETIDESTVSELYRIAEKEILPNTELAQIDPYVSIDEDSWDFYFGGVSNTGMMGVVKFYIHFKLTSDDIDLNEYVLPDAKLYPDFNYYKASLDFDIYTENGKVTDVVLESADIYKSDNSYDDHFSGKFGEAFNTEALENYIEKLAAPAAEEIYNAVSNL